MSFAALTDADAIYLSGITLAILPPPIRTALIEWLTKRRRSHALCVIFDSNYRPRLWEDPTTAREIMTAMWQVTDIGLPSCDDECALHGDADAQGVIARLRGWGVRQGALKCGANGPRSLAEHSVPGQFAKAPCVIDTTAAGDSFNGAYIAALASRRSEADALCAGHNLAIRVIGHRGAILPDD